jgi:hypothetical protein
MGLCNDGEISSSVVLIITAIKRRGWEGGAQHNTHITDPPPLSQPRLLIAVIIKTTDDEISPSLYKHINLTKY